MPDPLRLVVHKRLAGLLETVVAPSLSGPGTPMAGRVYRGRGVFGVEISPPAISILESPLPEDGPPSPLDSPVGETIWELVIQGWVVDDRLNPTDPAHRIMAEVKRVLALEKMKAQPRSGDPADGILGLGRSITAMYIGPGVVRPPDELNRNAYFWLTLGLDFNENMADPYVIE